MVSEAEVLATVVRVRSALFWAVRHRFVAHFPGTESDRVRIAVIEQHATKSQVRNLLSQHAPDEVQSEIQDTVHRVFSRNGYREAFGIAITGDVLQHLYDHLTDLVSDFYWRHGGIEAKALVVEQREPGGGQYHLEGGVSHRRDRVSLRISPTRFDWRTFSAIPAILVHEMVAHLGAGHDGTGNQHFSEGLMDRVSAKVLQRIALTGQLGFPAQRLNEAAEELRAENRKPFHDLGDYALSRLQAVISQSPLLGGRDAGILTLRLALALNASSMDVGSKDRLVDRLADPHPDPGLDERIIRAAYGPDEDLDHLVVTLLNNLEAP